MKQIKFSDLPNHSISHMFDAVSIERLEKLLKSPLLKYSVLSQMLTTDYYVGKTGIFSKQDYGAENKFQIAFQSCSAFQPLICSDTFKEDFCQDMNEMAEMGSEFTYFDGMSLDGVMFDERTYDFATQWNSPVIDLSPVKSEYQTGQSFNDCLHQIVDKMGWEKKQRYKVRKLGQDFDKRDIETTFLYVKDFSERSHAIENHLELLHYRFKGSNFTHACAQAVWGLSCQNNVCIRLTHNNKIIASGYFTILNDTALFQCLVADRQCGISDLGNTVLGSMIHATLERAYEGSEKVLYIDPTADTDPWCVDSVDIYKRLFLNKSNTRYGFCGITQKEINNYKPPYHLYDTTIKTGDWSVRPTFINRFDHDWIHDDKL